MTAREKGNTKAQDKRSQYITYTSILKCLLYRTMSIQPHNEHSNVHEGIIDRNIKHVTTMSTVNTYELLLQIMRVHGYMCAVFNLKCNCYIQYCID